MASYSTASPPSWFRIVVLLAVLWNAVGVYMYLHSVGLFGDPMADLTAAQRVAAESIPPAITAAFALGTFAGLIGSIGLLMRKGWAWAMLLLSLIALVVLEGWIVFLSGHRDAFGLAIPITVTVGAVLLFWLAHHARGRGWLS